ncbi:Os08g0278750, partial [Oryza sativa Japonica Group]
LVSGTAAFRTMLWCVKHWAKARGSSTPTSRASSVASARPSSWRACASSTPTPPQHAAPALLPRLRAVEVAQPGDAVRH